ncbi:hypothetical protein PSTG_01575 [Puccinia striiformis f. sp. tritici PST-78]|uniref:Uncharacterized protein n=1 Tax=Puccinia striiformis f. sp. tritici PST-78 TaxID=1165861 RepID=A0A0L0W259_9BASI|nr:hypothetical protein PSTG_01575 [Puccinia striiformis f. sp. tritici PST-78]
MTVRQVVGLSTPSSLGGSIAQTSKFNHTSDCEMQQPLGEADTRSHRPCLSEELIHAVMSEYNLTSLCCFRLFLRTFAEASNRVFSRSFPSIGRAGHCYLSDPDGSNGRSCDSASMLNGRSPIHPPSSKPYSTSARSSRPAPHQHWYGRVNRSATSPSRIHLYAICLSPAIQSAAVNQRIMKVNLLLLSLGQVTQIYRLRMDAA